MFFQNWSTSNLPTHSNKTLSLNHGKIRELYDTLEDMIDEDYKLPPSRVKLEVTKNAEYAEKIPDLYYALLSCIAGGEDEIKITGVRDDVDEDEPEPVTIGHH